MRLEDHKLLRGAGRFVDDIAVAGVLRAAFARSPIAHGLLRRIYAAAARAVALIEAAEARA
jgi:aerobic carbon-monoxide dehydrogenase large subunit